MKRIAEMGFVRLGFKIDDKIMLRMARESIHSPQLMQSICLNIGLLSGENIVISDDMVEESCRFTCVNLPYGDVVRVLREGPPTRGQQRLRYKLTDGTSRDIYSLILKVMADDPPIIELGMEELMERIRNNIGAQVIKPQKVRDSLKNWQKILETQGILYQVLEWKDESIHILDNLFLFYLRWEMR